MEFAHVVRPAVLVEAIPRSPRQSALAPASLPHDTISSAISLPFTPANNAQVAGDLTSANQVDLYAIQVSQTSQVSINLQTSTSGLQSTLRVFNSSGTLSVLNNQEGGDPSLSFQAAPGSQSNPLTYYIGVSSQGDIGYDPNTPNSGAGGVTTGLYVLNVGLTPGTTMQSDLSANSFRVTTPATNSGTANADAVTWGQTISGSFTLQNSGLAPAELTNGGASVVELELSNNPDFNPNTAVLVPLQNINLGQSSLAGGANLAGTSARHCQPRRLRVFLNRGRSMWDWSSLPIPSATMPTLPTSSESIAARIGSR